jgi:hypothetical protein
MDATKLNGLVAANDQPGKLTTISTRIFGAIHKHINRASSGLSLDLGIDAYCVLLLILATILPVQWAMIVASKAAQGTTDHHNGYQCIKSNLQALHAATMLEVLT